MDPYLILGVPPEATDADIRRAYLNGIRSFPPEHAPEQFQAIARAYEQIRDETSRLKLLLFDQELPGGTPLDTVGELLRVGASLKPMDFEQMKTFLALMYDEVESQGSGDGGELEGWKQRLREQVNEWLQDIGEIPDSEREEPLEDEPDLYSLYEELLALRNDSRKANRKTAETFSQFGESMGTFEAETRRLREQLNRMESAQASTGELPRAQCLALVEMLDRLHRLRAAMDRPPEPTWAAFLGGTRPWEESWEKLRQGFSILVTHFEALTKSAGIQTIQTLDTPFDPLSMVALATEPAGGRAPNLVVEEISAGYRWRNDVLRPAEVKITTNRS